MAGYAVFGEGRNAKWHVGDADNPPRCTTGAEHVETADTLTEAVGAVAFAGSGVGGFGEERLCSSCFTGKTLASYRRVAPR